MAPSACTRNRFVAPSLPVPSPTLPFVSWEKNRSALNSPASVLGFTPRVLPSKPPPGENLFSPSSTSTHGRESPQSPLNYIFYPNGFRSIPPISLAMSELFTFLWPTSTDAVGRPRSIPFSASSAPNFIRKASRRSTGPSIAPISPPPTTSSQKPSSSASSCPSCASLKNGFLPRSGKKPCGWPTNTSSTRTSSLILPAKPPLMPATTP